MTCEDWSRRSRCLAIEHSQWLTARWRHSNLDLNAAGHLQGDSAQVWAEEHSLDLRVDTSQKQTRRVKKMTQPTLWKKNTVLFQAWIRHKTWMGNHTLAACIWKASLMVATVVLRQVQKKSASFLLGELVLWTIEDTRLEMSLDGNCENRQSQGDRSHRTLKSALEDFISPSLREDILQATSSTCAHDEW